MQVGDAVEASSCPVVQLYSLATGSKVSATLLDLRAERSIPESLFPEDRQLNTLSAAMDSINRKFGRQTLVLGGMHTSRDSAPDRIAFHVIPKLEPDR